MLDAVALAGLAVSVKNLARFLIEQAALARAAGEISDEQYAQVKADAGVTDAEADAEYEAAKARIAAKRNP